MDFGKTVILKALDAGGGKVLLDASDGLYRLNADGSRDSTFGTNGFVRTPISPVDVKFESGGKMIVAGTSADNQFELVQYNADGSPDATFGANGVASFDPAPGKTITVNDLLIQSTGKIVVAGQAVDTSGNPVVLPLEYAQVDLVRFNADGTLDTTFGNGTPGVFHLGDGLESDTGIALYPDDRIFVSAENIVGFSGQEQDALAYTVAADGSAATLVEETKGLLAEISQPVIDSSGRLFVFDGSAGVNHLQAIDGTTVVHTRSGIAATTFTLDQNGGERLLGIKGNQVTAYTRDLAVDTSFAPAGTVFVPPDLSGGLRFESIAVVNSGADFMVFGSGLDKSGVTFEFHLTSAADGSPTGDLSGVATPRIGSHYGYATVAIRPGSGSLNLRSLTANSLQVNTTFDGEPWKTTGTLVSRASHGATTYATYAFRFPSRSFGRADNGVYTFTLLPAVSNTLGLPNAGMVLGSDIFYATPHNRSVNPVTPTDTPADALQTDVYT